jgi:Ni/Co efflux regulator RcnB
MKRFIVTAVAAAILVAPSLASAHDAPEDRSESGGEARIEHQAPQSRQYSGHVSPARPETHQAAPPPTQPRQQAWHRGDRFDRNHAPYYARVVHVDHYGLAAPPPGQVWVRSGGDALLVRLSNNTIVAISSGVFH